MAASREVWEADRARRLAVERLLELVGEAARAMSDEARTAVEGVGWEEVVGLRTFLAHHYHRVDADQVWVIASADLPELVRALERRGEPPAGNSGDVTAPEENPEG